MDAKVKPPALERPQGVGISVKRNEDRRFLDGPASTSPTPDPRHGGVGVPAQPGGAWPDRSIEVPEQYRGQVFFAADIAFAKPIVAVSAAKGFKPSDYPR